MIKRRDGNSLIAIEAVTMSPNKIVQHYRSANTNWITFDHDFIYLYIFFSHN